MADVVATLGDYLVDLQGFLQPQYFKQASCMGHGVAWPGVAWHGARLSLSPRMAASTV